ncbi:hypothetical protein [Crenobacter intestini]|uniref:Uncharacterized protein n=1 Tax=Crenobacter intestini TaxID=2563443 RepID=A0A4T0UNI9_9NEIS|nr:hypothetical protein [Crenobacter intestini]TIC80312.1 hypothetical protein E5K04_12465 [Crenobacter intestini]
MTIQSCELLLYRGSKARMQELPLEMYFSLNGARPDFYISRTSLRRGYCGSWEIHDGKLYLIGFDAVLKDGASFAMENLFHGCSERVFAEWFTGVLHVSQGARVGGDRYKPIFESSFELNLESGIVVKTTERNDSLYGKAHYYSDSEVLNDLNYVMKVLRIK